ncbi:hypothetical protein BFF78_34020 [Streptomyces fodineus]|uniref:Repetin n=1 Tax=Streptomyces fodineus TaxID=1904616 RepID=A0A1D7YIS4_9ACTN|nr:hypothetical protein [Streptomyces fodineus]AOR35422.1 hypothetical protein BFF78_34020 [Streptomyces fodineus]
MHIRRGITAAALAAVTATAGITLAAPAAYASNTTSSTVYKFYPGGGYKSTRTGEIDFVVTTTRDSKGDLVSASGTLSGHNNIQGQALGINMNFTQPYASGSSAGFTLTGKVVLQACIAKKLPVCGPSGTITFTDTVLKYGPQTPATAKSSNGNLWPIFSTP